MQAARLHRARGFHFLAVAAHALERVAARVVHRGRERHRCRQEGLDLVEAKAVAFQPQRQVQHVLVARAGVCRDEVGDQVLLLAGLAREAVEHLLETLVGADARLHHLRQRAFLGVLGRDLQVAADVVLRELLHILRGSHREVVAQPRADQHLLHAGQLASLAVQADQRGMVGVQVLAHVRVHARQAPAGALDFLRLAGHAVHVRGGPAEVRDHAGEAGRAVADLLDLAQDGFLRAALDDAPLVLGDRAEGAAAEAAAHDVDREADHLEGGDARLAVGRMGPALVGQVVDAVHLGRGERDRRRVDPHVALAVALHQRARVAGVRFHVEGARGVRVQHRVVAHGLVGGQAHHRARAVELAPSLRHEAQHLFGGIGDGSGRHGGACLHRVGVGMADQRAGRVHFGRIDLDPVGLGTPVARRHERAAAQVADLCDRLARGEAVRQRHDRALGVAEQQQVGLGIGQHRAAHLVGPVVVVRDAPEAGLDRADHDIGLGEGLAGALRVDRHGAIRAAVRRAVGGVGVIRADTAVGGVAVDHRIHVAGGDAEEQVRLAEGAEIRRRVPVRLADDADAKALGLEQAPDQRHAEAGMIDIGIAGDHDDVAGIPAERVHLGARHRQEGRHAKAPGPVLAVTEEIGCGLHAGIVTPPRTRPGTGIGQ
ncbi:MAG: hypothetical protein BWZ09_02087 [Alphaproteobacteria bacterium ADurb.BinA305]|nr:MAG: hypothetical protein BWZ09_02087 [Alphaproteobacteria bacterium ADurb.BinA305]